MPRVLVSGCFDLLHAGHIAFFESAAAYGDLYVCVGSDRNIASLKGHEPMFSEQERVYVLEHIECVTEARVSSGDGMLDFEPDMADIQPDVFVVNDDGFTESKAALCRKYGVECKVLPRIPAADFMARSSSDTKRRLQLPYRMCLAGGWMDQAWVSSVCAGSVVTVGLEPVMEFNDRSGMATSSRRIAEDLWGARFPTGNPEKTARILFACENPPGTEYVSGSQDAIGLVYPGINRLDYAGGYWPETIETCLDGDIVDWLGSVIHFVPLAPRPDGYFPLTEKDLRPEAVATLAPAGRMCWDAIMARDLEALGAALTCTTEGWKAILPLTVPGDVQEQIDACAGHAGVVPSGCGGGYLIVVSDKPVPNGFRVHIRREAN